MVHLLSELAATIIRNEKHQLDLEVEKEYQKLQALNAELANDPDDVEKQILRCITEDRLEHRMETRDIEMQKLITNTRIYLKKL